MLAGEGVRMLTGEGVRMLAGEGVRVLTGDSVRVLTGEAARIMTGEAVRLLAASSLVAPQLGTARAGPGAAYRGASRFLSWDVRLSLSQDIQIPGVQLGIVSTRAWPLASKLFEGRCTARLFPTPYPASIPYSRALDTDTTFGSFLPMRELSGCESVYYSGQYTHTHMTQQQDLPGLQPCSRASHKNAGCQCTMLKRFGRDALFVRD